MLAPALAVAQTPPPEKKDAPAASDGVTDLGQRPGDAPVVTQVPDLEAGFRTGVGMFVDGRTLGIDRKNNVSSFRGDVVAIGAGTIITADYIEVDRDNRALGAKGHVIILTPDQVFTGDLLNFYWLTGDLRITNAIMVAFDPERVAEVSNRILGITPEELYFETLRTQRMDFLAQKKESMRSEYLESVRQGEPPSENLVDRYALALEQEDLARGQQNPALAKMGPAKRKNFVKRRKYWEQARASTFLSGRSPGGDTSYFRITGRSIERTNGNDYKAMEATWTPCHCEEDETPAWGFYSQKMDAQIGGYVGMQDPVLQIKGFPVLYLPYLKVPIKSKRQSGFLFPSLHTGDQRLGTVYTQPVFFDFAPDFDMTFTPDIIERRGTRVKVEGRYEYRRHSGLEVKAETIRDRVWVAERETREKLVEYFLENQEDSVCTAAEVADDPDCVALRIREPLGVPSNTWRGAQEWRGQLFLAPRLSLVTNGKLVSDHRYVEDLSLTDNIEAALTPGYLTNSFTPAKGDIRYDGEDVYLGLGTSYGDNVYQNDKFKGLQMPRIFRVQSRVFDLDHERNLPVPVYLDVAASHISIQEVNGLRDWDRDDNDSLGTGKWQEVKASFSSPIVRDGAMRVKYFANANYRAIDASGLDGGASHIRSWMNGFTFNLPIDGQGVLPDFLQPDDWQLDGKGQRYVHHLMNWSLTLSSRPLVVRRGPYGESFDQKDAPLVYFASDRRSWIEGEDAADIVDTMVTHQRIHLSTSHNWRIFRKGWQLLRGKIPPEAATTSLTEGYHDRARRELIYSLDRPVGGVDQMMREQGGSPEWYINRYVLENYESHEPLQFNAGVAFDFEEERRRKNQIRRNKQLQAEGRVDEVVPYTALPQAWSPLEANLNLNLGGYNLATSVSYNMYERIARSLRFNLGMPEMLGVSMAYGYTLEKAAVPGDGILVYRKTRVRHLTLGTGLVPHVSIGASLLKRSEEEKEDQYETGFTVQYLSPSDCWGLRFSRVKGLTENEEDATYQIQLTVLFLGQQKHQNVGSSLIRQVPVGRDDES